MNPSVPVADYLRISRRGGAVVLGGALAGLLVGAAVLLAPAGHLSGHRHGFRRRRAGHGGAARRRHAEVDHRRHRGSPGDADRRTGRHHPGHRRSRSGRPAGGGARCRARRFSPSATGPVRPAGPALAYEPRPPDIWPLGRHFSVNGKPPRSPDWVAMSTGSPSNSPRLPRRRPEKRPAAALQPYWPTADRDGQQREPQRLSGRGTARAAGERGRRRQPADRASFGGRARRTGRPWAGPPAYRLWRPSPQKIPLGKQNPHHERQEIDDRTDNERRRGHAPAARAPTRGRTIDPLAGLLWPGRMRRRL